MLGFAAFAYLARVLAPQAYGGVEYAAGLALISSMFVDAGLSPIGVRRIAADPCSAEIVSAEVLGARFLLSVATALALGASAVWLAPDPLTARMVAVFAVSLLAFPWSQTWLLQAVDRIAWTAAVQTLRMATFLAVVLIAVRDTRDAIWSGGAELVGLAVSGAFGLALQRRFVAPVRLCFGRRSMRKLLLESLPIGLANLVALLTLFAPLLLAVNLLGAAAAAHFAAAHRLFFALVTLTWVYHFNFFPVLARANAKASVDVQCLVAASMRLVSWAGAGAALGLTLVAAPLLAAMFGPPFGDAAAAFGVLVWALPVKLIADHCNWLLIADGGERAVTAVRLLGLALALFLGAPLVYAWGPAGGAAALLVAAIASWGGLHLATRRRLGWMPWTPAVPALLCAGAILALLPSLDLAPFSAGVIGVVTFAALALLLRRRLAADCRLLAGAKARQGAQRSA